MKKRMRLMPILMAIMMVFTMMPLIGGVVYADDPVYTVTIDPGDGEGGSFTVQSTTICNSFEEFLEWNRGNVGKENGCFYRDGESVFYVFPKVCSFTAPENKEFNNWKFIIGDAYQDLFDGGTHFDLTGTLAGGATSFTLEAQWKDVEPDSNIEYSTPDAIQVGYGDTRTAFDVQVTDRSFTQGKTACSISLWDSAFTCSENGGSIPFTMNGNGTGNYDKQFSAGGGAGTGYKFFVHTSTTLPYTVQAYIDISSDDWAAAEPGEYTATLKIGDSFGGTRNIPLTLTVPDKNAVHTVTVTNNGNGTTAVKSINWKINKAANPLTIKAKTATVKGSTKGKNGKLKKTKTLAVSKVIAFTKKGQGKMTYTKSSGSKKITINKTTGKVTVKKGLKKGTYKVKVKVKAAGNANYKASAWKTVTFKIKVK